MPLPFTHFKSHRVLEHARRVAQRAEHVGRVALTRLADALLDGVVDLALCRRHKARSHWRQCQARTIRATGSERQRGCETAAIRDTARRDERRRDLLRRQRHEHEAANVVFTGMARALEAINAQHVRAELECLEAVAHSRALVDHESACVFEDAYHGLSCMLGPIHVRLLPAVSKIRTPASSAARA